MAHHATMNDERLMKMAIASTQSQSWLFLELKAPYMTDDKESCFQKFSKDVSEGVSRHRRRQDYNREARHRQNVRVHHPSSMTWRQWALSKHVWSSRTWSWWSWSSTLDRFTLYWPQAIEIMAALLFARRTVPVLGLATAGMSLLWNSKQKEQSRQHFNHLSKSSCGTPRDWQRDSPVPSFSASKELLSQPASRLGTRNDTGTLRNKHFHTSKISCEAATLTLKESNDMEDVQATTELVSIPLYGIPE
jgi:hypothetical protein